MNGSIKAVKKKITILTIALSVFSVLLMSFVLSWVNTRNTAEVTDIDGVHQIIAGESAVAQYIDEQKGAEPHFVTISNLVKKDQKDAIEGTFVATLVPILLISGGVGWFVARYILRPVNESFASQERFIQDAAHELRNPLAAMNIAVSNQKSKKSDPFTKVVDRQTKRLISITEDLLFLERRRSGEQLEEVNVSELTHDVIEDLTPLINEKSLQIVLIVDDNVLHMMNSNDYVVMFKNILHNAVKYTQAKDKIEITLRAKKHGFKLVVQDSGIGISNEDLAKIGERFFRASNSGDIDGTGLGLSIVKKVVNLYSGSFDISSKLKKGTTVTINL